MYNPLFVDAHVDQRRLALERFASQRRAIRLARSLIDDHVPRPRTRRP